jgi:hypothetical protein
MTSPEQGAQHECSNNFVSLLGSCKGLSWVHERAHFANFSNIFIEMVYTFLSTTALIYKFIIKIKDDLMVFPKKTGMLFLLFLLVALFAEAHSGWFSAPSMQREIDTQPSLHNKISLFSNSAESRQKRINNLLDADYIFIKTFEFRDDEAGYELINLLSAKANAGAKIFIQFDVKATRNTKAEQIKICSGKENPISAALLRLEKEAHGNVFIIPSNIPAGILDHLAAFFSVPTPNNHEKYFITWNSKNPNASVKAMNGFKDADFEMTGPIVQEMMGQYLKSAALQLKNRNRYFQKNLARRVALSVKKIALSYEEMAKTADTAFPKSANAIALLSPQ